jgi:DNA-binding MarR family transcriptional regulator
LREIIRVFTQKLGLLQKTDAACCGVTLGQCHAIVEIGRVGETSVNELAEVMNLDKSTTSRTINNLVNSNVVVRETDPQDRRFTKIRLTPKGQGLFCELNDNMDQYYEQILGFVPEDKRELVREAMPYLLEAVRQGKNCIGEVSTCCVAKKKST